MRGKRAEEDLVAWIQIVGRDLKDRDRLDRAAAAAGLGTSPAEGSPALVVIDLDREGVPAALPPGVPAVGYYSHIDEDVAERAAAAGITPIRRGAFWADLADILRRYSERG
jgi:hypothetical protein